MLYRIRRGLRLISLKIIKECMYFHNLNEIPVVNAKIEVSIQNLDKNNISKIQNVKHLNIERLIKRLERGDKCYVAIYENKVVSYHWVQFNGSHFVQQAGKSYVISDLECYIYHVRVLESYRGQGINQKVYSYILNDCKSENITKVWIYTNLNNKSNRRGIEKLGFNLNYIIYSLKIGEAYYSLYKKQYR